MRIQTGTRRIQSGKHHWVVRLGAARACWGYTGIAIVAYVWLIGMVIAELLPSLTSIALFPAILSLRVGRELMRYADSRAKLLRRVLQLRLQRLQISDQ